MTDLHINAERLLGRLQTLGNVGRDADGKLTRLAASDADRAGRDAVAGWMREAGLEVMVDRIGNLFGLWEAKCPSGDFASDLSRLLVVEMAA
jgi:N-carbamoyl-L-amino-acid hydrolase